MRTRRAALAGQWYEGTQQGCQRALERLLRADDFSPPTDLGTVMGGVVPHAGWRFSGAAAGKVFSTLKARAAPETIVLFGAAHRGASLPPMIDSHDAWDTPLGAVIVDAELRQAALDRAAAAGTALELGDEALAPPENSLELQMPFVKYLFGEAMVLPVGAPPAPGVEEVGRVACEATASLGRRVVFVGSSDLTHYGSDYGLAPAGPLPRGLPWMKANDRKMIALLERLAANELIGEADDNSNACGAGALAAAAAAAQAAGAKGARLLQYTTSAEVLGDLVSSCAVGYAAMVFHG